jgi:ABC-2 type transport system permease protein
MTAVLRSEWVKFRSLRSMAWTLLTVVALMAGFGALFSYGRGRAYVEAVPADRAGFDPTATSLTGLMVAQVAVAVLGVLVITSEFATGTIRPSLTVVPRRGRLLAAKAVMLTVVAFVAGTVAGLAAFLLGQPILGRQGVPHTAFGDPGTIRAIVGSGLFLAATAVFGLALGAIVRVTAGALTIAITLLLMTPVFAQLLPAALYDWVSKWWPSLAGLRVSTLVPDPHLLGPWQGISVLAGFAVAVLVVAFVDFRRRDV